MTAGYALKLQRANHHLNELKVKSDEWLNGERHTIIHEDDPDGPFKRRIRIVFKEPFPSDPLSLIIGDALYNLRSCLDNLAFDLNGGANGIGNESEFPIFGNENRKGHPVDGAKAHRSQFDKKVSGMSNAAKAAIERLQPYHRGHKYTSDPLWFLNSLCNMDKHRAIHVIAGAYVGSVVDPSKCVNFSGDWEVKTHIGALETETIVARYTPVPIRHDLEVNVDFSPMIDIGFASGPACGESATDILSVIYNYVALSIVEPLSKFL